eukprot:403341718
MRKAVLRELKHLPNNIFLLSYNRYLYVLQNKIVEQNRSEFFKMAILKSFVWESNVYFDVMEKRNYLLIGEQKDIKIYNLQDFLAQQPVNPQVAETLNMPLVAEYKSKKRITSMKVAPHIETKDKIIEGFMLTDKVGEVRFVNIDNLFTKEKKSPLDADDLGTTLYGHLQQVSALQFSPDGKLVASVDTLQRVRVSDFPNVFHVRQFHLNHKFEITDFALTNETLLTYSALDSHLVHSDITSDRIYYEQKGAQNSQLIESLGLNKSNQLVVLEQNTETKQYSVKKIENDQGQNRTQEVVNGLTIGEGDKITIAQNGFVIRVNINPENGIINGETIDALELQ